LFEKIQLGWVSQRAAAAKAARLHRLAAAKRPASYAGSETPSNQRCTLRFSAEVFPRLETSSYSTT
jgi:hypothetical protein